MSEAGLAAAVDVMRAAGIGATAIDVFSRHYLALAEGATGLVPEDSIDPVTDLDRLDALDVDPEPARRAFAETALIKLNGGLGTSMGLDRAKTLLPVRDGTSFLDLIALQVLRARERHDVRLPVMFMNSFRTQDDTMAALQAHPGLAVEGLPLSFVQSSEPKLRADDLTPVSWPADPTLEWCPPGHGDLYTVLHGSGLVDRLLEMGFRHVFVSNGDNLGAVPDPRLAGWFAESGAPFAVEVCTRTANDRKGGHLAVRKADRRLVLRESAMVVDGEMGYFTDETRHQFFNTNNLWVHLPALKEQLDARGGVLDLPLIRNTKTVDPSDKTSTPVIQIESAMGAAVEVFEGATAIVVGRDRFLPVKTTNELMIVRSDLFALDEDSRLVQQAEIPTVRLAAEHYKLVDDFDLRVPVAPSLRRATSLVVEGDYRFEPDVVVVGDVLLPDTGEPTLLHGTVGA